MVKIEYDLTKMSELQKEVTVMLNEKLKNNTLTSKQIKKLNKILND